MEWTETRVEMTVLPTITDLLNNPDNNVVEREQKTYATAYAHVNKWHPPLPDLMSGLEDDEDDEEARNMVSLLKEIREKKAAKKAAPLEGPNNKSVPRSRNTGTTQISDTGGPLNVMAEHMVIQSSNGGNGAIVEISNDGGSSSSKHDPSDQDERIPRSVAPSKPPIIFLLSLHQANPSTVLITQLRMNIDIRLRIVNREDIRGKEHLRPRATI